MARKLLLLLVVVGALWSSVTALYKFDNILKMPPRPTRQQRYKVSTSFFRDTTSTYHAGCDDPDVYVLYSRVTIGVPGSTETEELGVYRGKDICQGRLTTAIDKEVTQTMSKHISVGVFYMVGIEMDNYDVAFNHIYIANPVHENLKLLEDADPMEADYVVNEINSSRDPFRFFYTPIPGRTTMKDLVNDFAKEHHYRRAIEHGNDPVGSAYMMIVEGTGLKSQPISCSGTTAAKICVPLTYSTILKISDRTDSPGVWDIGVKIERI